MELLKCKNSAGQITRTQKNSIQDTFKNILQDFFSSYICINPNAYICIIRLQIIYGPLKFPKIFFFSPKYIIR